MSDDNAGIEDRYEVRRRYDPKGKHAKCGYFVLDPQHDEFARVAMWHYAAAVEPTNPVLAHQLLSWINDFDPSPAYAYQKDATA